MEFFPLFIYAEVDVEWILYLLLSSSSLDFKNAKQTSGGDSPVLLYSVSKVFLKSFSIFLYLKAETQISGYIV